MEEIIKIARNGQWALEKGRTSEEQQRLIEQFVQQKRKEAEARAAATANKQPEPPKPNPLEGLQPVKHLTGENPDLTREQVARMRQGLTTQEATAEAAAQKRRDERAKNRPNPIVSTVPHIPSLQAKAAKEAAINPQGDKGTAADIAAAQQRQGRKAAWQATTEFLANQGDRGMRRIAEEGQQRAVLNQRAQNIDAGIKPMASKPTGPQELQPPMAPRFDEKTGARVYDIKQGDFHGQGHTTAGKLVENNYWYKKIDPETGEEKLQRGTRTQQQKHHWTWDHGKKQWNHTHTTLGNPELGKG